MPDLHTSWLFRPSFTSHSTPHSSLIFSTYHDQVHVYFLTYCNLGALNLFRRVQFYSTSHIDHDQMKRVRTLSRRARGALMQEDET